MSTQTTYQFAEKVALVSDASGPIGRAAAMQLALQGCFVVGLFPFSNGKETLNELVELGTLAHALYIDPSSETNAVEAAAEVDRLFGRLDLLVNCLKFKPDSAFEDTNESVFMETLSKNIGSATFLTRAVFGLMKNRPKPKIVNVVSRSASDTPVFAASQAGIKSLTKSMALSFPANFRVNCVEIEEKASVDQGTEGGLFTLGSKPAADDVARTVLFLLSSESILLNGQVVSVG